MAMLPACLIFPLEKRLSNFLFAKSQNLNPNASCSVIISKKGAKEMSPEMLKKYTKQHPDGTRTLKDDAPARTQKDVSVYGVPKDWTCTIDGFDFLVLSLS